MSLRQQLRERLTEKIGNIEAEQVQEFCQCDVGALSLLQWKLLTNISKKSDITFDLEDDICWVLTEKHVLETLLCSGYVQEHKWKEVIQLLREMLDLDPQAHTGYRLKLAVAITITFSSDLKSLACPDVSIDGKKRYQNFINWAESEELFPIFFTLSAWQMRYVVGSWAQDEELEWARKHVLEEFKCPEKIGEATHKMVKYKDKNDEGVSVHEGAKYYNYQPVTMALLHKVGAVCGGVSKFGSAMAQAFGVPAMPVAQPGHCAFLWWRNGDWVLSNDVSGINQSTMHEGIQWTWIDKACYVQLMEDAQKDMEKYKMSEKLRIAAKFCREGKGLDILEKSLNFSPSNFLVWRDIAIHLKRFRSHAKRGAWLGNCLGTFETEKSNIQTISRNKEVSVSSCQERSQIMVDGTESEWWTEEETASIEIDFGCKCQVESLEIQWWGSSVSKNFVILAISGENYEPVKHNEDAIEKPHGLNSWSKFNGWEAKTRKIKLELKSGSLDPWGMNKYFGIRQINVRGRELCPVLLLSKDRPVKTSKYHENQDGTATEGSAEMNVTRIEIDLQQVSLLDHILFQCSGNSADRKVQIQTSVDGNIWKNAPTDEKEIKDSWLNIKVCGLATYVRLEVENGPVDCGGESILLENVLVYGMAISIEEILLTRLKRELALHPKVLEHICEILKNAQYTNISHKKPCNSSDSQDRADNVVDGTDSEWWTEDDSAWIEVDLGSTHKVHKLQIQWWGTSVSKSYSVLAAVEEGKFVQVMTQIDEEDSPEGCNGWSKLGGWDRETRFVRINLENGSLDPWGMNKYFGIRQIIVISQVY